MISPWCKGEHVMMSLYITLVMRHFVASGNSEKEHKSFLTFLLQKKKLNNHDTWRWKLSFSSGGLRLCSGCDGHMILLQATNKHCNRRSGPFTHLRDTPLPTPLSVWWMNRTEALPSFSLLLPLPPSLPPPVTVELLRDFHNQRLPVYGRTPPFRRAATRHVSSPPGRRPARCVLHWVLPQITIDRRSIAN